LKSAIVASVEIDMKPWGLGGDFEDNARFLSELGFDGVELAIFELSHVKPGKVWNIVERYHLEIPAIAQGKYYEQHGISFSTDNHIKRKKAIAKIKESIEVAGELNSNVIIGGVQGKYEKSYEDSFHYLQDCLYECSKTAEEQNVLLLIEPINRYGPGLITTIGEAVRIIEEVGSPNIKVVADSHHMNIEERSMGESIRQSKGYLAHFHASDSNRLAPGQGHIDFGEIASTLKEIGYRGYLSAEILPVPDQWTAAKQTIQHLKPLL
jgi:sugar phosphate isomerase/epimerase